MIMLSFFEDFLAVGTKCDLGLPLRANVEQSGTFGWKWKYGGTWDGVYEFSLPQLHPDSCRLMAHLRIFMNHQGTPALRHFQPFGLNDQLFSTPTSQMVHLFLCSHYPIILT
jgi:hypothetical protein